MCCGGWLRRMVLDDFIPVANHRPTFAYNREEPNELW
eukprot:gene8145-17576_t